MKKILVATSLLAVTSYASLAQRIDDAKNLIILQQFDKAKENIDKNWSNPKYTAKPEAYILKGSVYAYVGNSPNKGEAGVALIDEGEKVYREYLEKDPKKPLTTDPAYANAPSIFYSSYINRGIAEYNKKEYEKAYGLFVKSLFYSSLLNETGIYKMPIDTICQLLAGAAAQNMNTPEYDKLAMEHYKILAAIKYSAEDGISIYRFLQRKSYDANDIESFNKYRAIGRELYPKEEFFTYEEEDFLFSIENQEEKIRRIKMKLESDPNNAKVQAAYGEYLFDQLNPRDNEAIPENAGEMEKEMVKAFEKVSQLQPENALPVLNLANHFNNKSVRTQNSLVDHQKMMRDKQKANTPEPVKGKPAPKPPAPDPADVEKRKALQAKYESEIKLAGGYYESAVGMFSKNPALTNMEKQNYRNAVSYLIDINKELKNAAIRDKVPADEAKYAAAEKKYMDLYATLNK
jgi:hypothetical protein